MVESFSGAKSDRCRRSPAPPRFESIRSEMMELPDRRGYQRRCSSGLCGINQGEGQQVRRGREEGVGRGGRGRDAVMDGE